MLFAAGLGTRMRPLTLHRPKALLEIGRMTLLEIALRRLRFYGCTGVIVNVHYLAEQVIDFLQQSDWGLEVVISDERDMLLETGGGLKKASWYLQDAPFLVVNADILTDVNLRTVYQTHLEGNDLVTLAVLKRTTSRYFLFDTDDLLCGWRNVKTGEERWSRRVDNAEAHAFSGVHVLDPAIFEWMPDDKEAFSIIDTYLQAAVTERLRAYHHNDDEWFDVGTPEVLEAVQQWPLAQWLPEGA